MILQNRLSMTSCSQGAINVSLCVCEMRLQRMLPNETGEGSRDVYPQIDGCERCQDFWQQYRNVRRYAAQACSLLDFRSCGELACDHPRTSVPLERRSLLDSSRYTETVSMVTLIDEVTAATNYGQYAQAGHAVNSGCNRSTKRPSVFRTQLVQRAIKAATTDTCGCS